MSSFMNSSYGLQPLGLGIWDDDRGGLYRVPSNWFPRQRHVALRSGMPFFELWRTSCFGADNGVMAGTDWDSNVDEYESWHYGEGGHQGWYYIKGQVVDGSSVPQSGVSVKGFRTSDNLYVGATTSDSSGNYMLPTPYIGVSHFIVAYLDVATDLAGTTVFNLTPTAS